MSSRSDFERSPSLHLVVQAALVSLLTGILFLSTVSCNQEQLLGSIDSLVQVTPPVFSIEEGTYNHDLSVEITSDLEGADIYYTTDFSLPTEESELYAGPIDIAGHGTGITLRAMATRRNMVSSASADAEYLIMYDQVATPVFSHGSGVYSIDLDVTLSCSDGAAAIYYTTDGSPPNSSSTKYTGTIELRGSGTYTINALALKEGYPRSDYVTRVYEISYPQVAAPTFSPSGGAYTGLVTIDCSESGADIYYGINSPPTILYTGPVAVSSTPTTINAQAKKANMDDSLIGSASFN